MAKKYLLYIHADKDFDAVENKSELINDLLDKYWNDEDFVESKGIERTMLNTPDPTPDPEVISPPQEMEEPPKKIITETCKAGHPIPQGRDRCMMPGCKWSIYV